MSQTVLHISVSVHTFICTSKCSTAIHGLWKPVNSQDISHFLMSAGMHIDRGALSLSVYEHGCSIIANKNVAMSVLFGLKLIKDGSTPSDSSKTRPEGKYQWAARLLSSSSKKEQITLSPLPILWQHINTAERRGTVVYEARN